MCHIFIRVWYSKKVTIQDPSILAQIAHTHPNLSYSKDYDFFFKKLDELVLMALVSKGKFSCRPPVH